MEGFSLADSMELMFTNLNNYTSYSQQWLQNYIHAHTDFFGLTCQKLQALMEQGIMPA